MAWLGRVVRLACVLVLVLPTLALAATPSRPLVTVRLFLDLECPHSRQAWPIYRDALKAFPQTTLVVHHLPLSRHPHAQMAAIAAVAARAQGREQEFIDALLRGPVPDAQALARAAREANLDADDFAKAVEAPETAAAVDREHQAGLAFGIQATPSALVNGRGVAGAPPPEALARMLQIAGQEALALRREQGPAVDVERQGLLRQAPEFAAAFDALVAGKPLAAPAAVPVAQKPRLGERYRVELQPSELAAGSPAAPVTAVLFVDPLSGWQMAQLRALLARHPGADLRVVAVPLPRLDAKGQLDHAQQGPLDVALLLAAAQQLRPESSDKLLAQLADRLDLGPADVEAAAASLGIGAADLRRAVAAPAATVRVQRAVDLAARVDAQPGAIFLNGRKWLGQASDPALSAALQELTAEARARQAAGVAPDRVYAELIAGGRWRSDEERDLLAPEHLGDVSLLPEFGTSGPPVHLFVDFASPHSRAAFYMVRRLASGSEPAIRLRMVSIASGAEPAVTASGAAFVTAAQMGKGLEFAEHLFAARSPNDWPTVFAIVKKLKLPLATFQKQVDAQATRAVADVAARLLKRLDIADEPVLYIGDRLYAGPLDEGRIERAIRFVQGTAPAGPAAQPRPLLESK